MRILIFAPNAGASLGTGGGVGSTLRQATMLSELGHDVTVAGYHAYDRATLERIHGLRIPEEIALRRGTGMNLPRMAGGLGVKLSAYNLLLVPGFREWAVSTLKASAPELVWFHDDIPACLEDHLGGLRVFTYVHYPFEARTSAFLPPVNDARSLTERVNETLLQQTRIVSRRTGRISEMTWTNSSFTRSVVERLWAGAHATILPLTYVDPPRPVSRYGQSVVAIGSFSRNKSYETLIDGFLGSELDSWDLVLIGHARDPRYLSRLRKRSERAASESKRVLFLPDATRDVVDQWIGSSSIQVHPAIVEPFGFSLLEGMSSGLAAITRRSEWSGAWTDILERGTWGLGFDTSEELSERLTEAARSSSLRSKSLERAGQFTRSSVRSAVQGACAA